jgi:hypothetical protein
MAVMQEWWIGGGYVGLARDYFEKIGHESPSKIVLSAARFTLLYFTLLYFTLVISQYYLLI